jgi:signal transduction histidine kinase
MRSAMLGQFLRVYLAVILPVIVIVLLASWFSDEVIARRGFVEQIRYREAARFSWIREQLVALPVDQWKARLDSARQLYPSGVAIEEAADFFDGVHPVDDERARFERGEVAFAPAPRRTDMKGEHPGMTFSFTRVPGTSFVLSSQLSFSNSNELLTYLYYLTFAAIAAAPILWFWFRPFWRDLERLGQVAEQIGSGDFSVQAAPVRSATVKPFAAAIDQMSLRIGELIDAQKRLTNSVAHELTTPITQLVFALAILKEPPDRTRTAQLIDGMSEDLNELESLVAELLEYARLEHTAVFEPELVDVRQLLERALDHVQHKPDHGKVIALDPQEGRGTRVRCDAHQMQRAVLNLLRNALHYAQRQVTLSVQQRDGRTCIHVDDDGPGIPAEERVRLYEPFARADASRTRDTGGHGLGLAIVQQVAKLHGGVSRIEASPLGGARVSIEW